MFTKSETAKSKKNLTIVSWKLLLKSRLPFANVKVVAYPLETPAYFSFFNGHNNSCAKCIFEVTANKVTLIGFESAIFAKMRVLCLILTMRLTLWRTDAKQITVQLLLCLFISFQGLYLPLFSLSLYWKSTLPLCIWISKQIRMLPIRASTLETRTRFRNWTRTRKPDPSPKWGQKCREIDTV